MPDGEKVGGIKRNYWYVIGAAAAIAGYVIYRWYKNNQTANAANLAAASMPTGAGTATTNMSPTTGGAATTISTLSDWMTQAQQWLVSSINADPAVVQNALQDYSNGVCLDAQSYAYIDQALGQLGMPPDAPYQGLIKCPNTPAPPPPTPPPTSTPPPTGGAIPSSGIPSFMVKITSWQAGLGLIERGYNMIDFGGAWYYNPNQTTTGKSTYGQGALNWISNMQTATELQKAGYKLYRMDSGLYYDPTQKVY